MKILLNFLFFIVFLVSCGSTEWKRNSFSNAIQPSATFDFPFNSGSTQINYAVNCSSPCKMELVSTVDVTKVKNNLGGYLSYFTSNSESISEINVNITEISNGLSLTVKNTGTTAFNVWVDWNYFYTTQSTITGEQIAYIIVGIIGGACVCFAISGSVIGIILFYLMQKKYGNQKRMNGDN